MVVPLYVAELAPAKARGQLIGLNNISITLGQVIAYALGAAQLACLSHSDREAGRLTASGLLFTAAAQILTLRKIEDLTGDEQA